MSAFDIDSIISKDLSPNAPASENNIRSKMQAYNIVFRFPTSPNKDAIAFPAYITGIEDGFNVQFSDERVYGRMDPIPVYSGTSRRMSFSLSIPSNGLSHSIEIREKLNILVKNLYPSYIKSTNNVNIISSPPLVEVYFSNFIYDSSTGGYLLGYFSGGFNIRHDLSKGVFAAKSGHLVFPKFYELSFNLSVLHRFTPGYIDKGEIPIQNELTILKSARG